MWNGGNPTVIVASYDRIMETFQKDGDAYAGRVEAILHGKLYVMTRGKLPPKNVGIHICMYLGEPRGGVILTNGDLWRDHRRFALHVLRDFGLGKDLMQERVTSIAKALLNL